MGYQSASAGMMGTPRRLRTSFQLTDHSNEEFAPKPDSSLARRKSATAADSRSRLIVDYRCRSPMNLCISEHSAMMVGCRRHKGLIAANIALVSRLTPYGTRQPERAVTLPRPLAARLPPNNAPDMGSAGYSPARSCV